MDPNRAHPSALLLLALLALPAAAPAAVTVTVGAGPAPVELLAPADGAVLVAGQRATIAWAPLPGFAEHRFEEWEAFLSFDGGASYTARVTPHLEIDLERFQFEVPAVASRDVRVMLRFGDEVEERGWEMPLALSLAVPAAAAPSRAEPTARRGEAARPGEPGVVVWVDGTRDGRDLRRRRTRPAPPGAGPGIDPGSAGRLAAALLSGGPRDGAPGAPRATGSAPPLPAPTPPPPAARAVAAADLLLLIQRSNR